MPEQVLYFDQEHHTGHLREAASELLHQDLRIVEICADRVSGVNPTLSPLRVPTLLRLAISSQSVPEKTRRKWDRLETWVIRLLVSARIIRYPHITYMKLGEYM